MVRRVLDRFDADAIAPIMAVPERFGPFPSFSLGLRRERAVARDAR
jgi:hypothetical protein